MSKNKELGDKFKIWANSFAGCEGGIPGAPTWLCGIEWGFAKDQKQGDYDEEAEKYYHGSLPEEIAKRLS